MNLPTAWPQTIRAAMDAIQYRRNDQDAPHSGRTVSAERRHTRRLEAMQAALVESIATYGLEAEPDDEHGWSDAGVRK